MEAVNDDGQTVIPGTVEAGGAAAAPKTKGRGGARPGAGRKAGSKKAAPKKKKPGAKKPPETDPDPVDPEIVDDDEEINADELWAGTLCIVGAALSEASEDPRFEKVATKYASRFGKTLGHALRLQFPDAEILDPKKAAWGQVALCGVAMATAFRKMPPPVVDVEKEKNPEDEKKKPEEKKPAKEQAGLPGNGPSDTDGEGGWA